MEKQEKFEFSRVEEKARSENPTDSDFLEIESLRVIETCRFFNHQYSQG